MQWLPCLQAILFFPGFDIFAQPYTHVKQPASATFTPHVTLTTRAIPPHCLFHLCCAHMPLYNCHR